MTDRPSYLGVFLTFARNSLVRDMTYRANFLIECVTSLAWVLRNLGFYEVVFTCPACVGGPGPEGLGLNRSQTLVSGRRGEDYACSGQPAARRLDAARGGGGTVAMQLHEPLRAGCALPVDNAAQLPQVVTG